MTLYKNIDSGEIWTEEEAKKACEQFAHDAGFDDPAAYMDYLLDQGRQQIGGLVEVKKGEIMKSYFIADDHGTIYAHDIQTETEAELTLADILTAHPEYRELNLEILEDEKPTGD